MTFEKFLANNRDALIAHYLIALCKEETHALDLPDPMAELSDEEYEKYQQEILQLGGDEGFLDWLRDFDFHVQEYLEQEWFEIACFGDESTLSDVAEELAEVGIGAVHEYAMEHGFDSEDDFHDHALVQATAFVTALRTNIRALADPPRRPEAPRLPPGEVVSRDKLKFLAKVSSIVESVAQQYYGEAKGELISLISWLAGSEAVAIPDQLRLKSDLERIYELYVGHDEGGREEASSRLVWIHRDEWNRVLAGESTDAMASTTPQPINPEKTPVIGYLKIAPGIFDTRVDPNSKISWD